MAVALFVVGLVGQNTKAALGGLTAILVGLAGIGKVLAKRS